MRFKIVQKILKSHELNVLGLEHLCVGLSWAGLIKLEGWYFECQLGFGSQTWLNLSRSPWLVIVYTRHMIKKKKLIFSHRLWAILYIQTPTRPSVIYAITFMTWNWWAIPSERILIYNLAINLLPIQIIKRYGFSFISIFSLYSYCILQTRIRKSIDFFFFQKIVRSKSRGCFLKTDL